MEIKKKDIERKFGRIMELPRVKYWEDRRVTIYITGHHLFLRISASFLFSLRSTPTEWDVIIVLYLLLLVDFPGSRTNEAKRDCEDWQLLWQRGTDEENQNEKRQSLGGAGFSNVEDKKADCCDEHVESQDDCVESADLLYTEIEETEVLRVPPPPPPPPLPPRQFNLRRCFVSFIVSQVWGNCFW